MNALQIDEEDGIKLESFVATKQIESVAMTQPQTIPPENPPTADKVAEQKPITSNVILE
jgi:hypothetical protein